MPSVDDGKIELPITLGFLLSLLRDMSMRNTDLRCVLNNLLEFNLYEPRRDKAVERKVLWNRHYGHGVEYGAIKRTYQVLVFH
ncbi:hypothetical protein Nepgr_005862 [Nepenthes gracilis]|uniref:Uncharacterized protein n=1 Tax=Nepenthes gracilis TaxID=150966 RepID=A0AAD3S428_NEPGR|nr:hypothetical protein Nepgr_005862 [Nepenthes gracilis]